MRLALTETPQLINVEVPINVLFVTGNLVKVLAKHIKVGAWNFSCYPSTEGTIIASPLVPIAPFVLPMWTWLVAIVIGKEVEQS